MTGYTDERRKTLVVNKPLQGRLMLNMALLPAIALAGIAIFTGIYCSRLMQHAIETDTELPGLVPLFYLVIAFELVAAIFLMVNSLKISHRVAGPALRICKSLERIRAGDLAFMVNLRQGDHLGEIRDELNKLLDWLNDNPPPGCVTRAAAAQLAMQEAAAAAADAAQNGAAAAPSALLPIAGSAESPAGSPVVSPMGLPPGAPRADGTH